MPAIRLALFAIFVTTSLSCNQGADREFGNIASDSIQKEDVVNCPGTERIDQLLSSVCARALLKNHYIELYPSERDRLAEFTQEVYDKRAAHPESAWQLDHKQIVLKSLAYPEFEIRKNGILTRKLPDRVDSGGIPELELRDRYWVTGRWAISNGQMLLDFTAQHVSGQRHSGHWVIVRVKGDSGSDIGEVIFSDGRTGSIFRQDDSYGRL